ncbi:MAG: hypothetical protein RLZZ450_5446 [Pseudomonadota bacterium]|jgi:hypothetical protein
MTSPTLTEKYQAEIARLDAEHDDLARMWTQVPWFVLFAALSPVVWAVWGWGAGVVELMVTGALVGTRAYLIAVRQTENRWNRTKLVNDLDEQLAAPSLDVEARQWVRPMPRSLRHSPSAA